MQIPNFNTTTQIPVMEHFYTIQGEGNYTGSAAYFIRLAGCDVGCVWCDVKESWIVNKNQILNISELILEIQKYPCNLIVITGGEPLIYDLEPLTAALKSKGYIINIETSGAYPISGQLDWICLSPKKFKAPLPEILKLAHELKIIVYNKSDFKWANSFIESVSDNCKLYLQPEWSAKEKMMPQIIDYVKQNPKWLISIQTHKYLNIP
jgi:organic radical activating enzyme